jgi:glycosyltransferase 2 family protein
MMYPKDSAWSRSLVRSVLFVTGLGAILAMAWIVREELIALWSTLQIGFMALAIVAGVVFMATQGLLFRVLMAKHGAPATTSTIIAAFLVSQPGKYIPGKVWPVMMQTAALGRGHGLTRVALANLELIGISMLHMTGLGFACLWLNEPPLAGAAIAVVTFLGASIIVSRSERIASHLPRRVRRLLGLEVITGTRLVYRLGRAILLSGGLVGINLLASLCVLLALGEFLPRELYAPVLAVLYLSFAASMLVVPMPAGIGVREGASVGLAMLLAPEVPAHIIVSVALLARSWQLLTDGASFTIGAGLLYFSRHGRPDN